mmetsp:Transcript_7124/g.15562  ORF Transcript_7124/g.15562 Transcript_7124/m.15562 type:complete len:343 (-) Transcript_7124:123-1151(-)
MRPRHLCALSLIVSAIFAATSGLLIVSRLRCNNNDAAAKALSTSIALTPLDTNAGHTDQSPSKSSHTKIVGFTDAGYVILAMKWYDKLQALGYHQHVIVAVDEESVNYFAGTEYRFENYSVSRNTTLNWRRQVFRARVEYCLKQVQEGTSLLLTDVDNTFNRYLDLDIFERSKHDIYHAYGTVFPRNVLDLQGFVVCGGHIWYTANSRTVDYLRRILQYCGEYECDDQGVINAAMVLKMGMEWDENVDEDEAEVHQNSAKHRKRQHERYGVAERSGYSSLTGHTVKIWHRDFAYRGPVDPDICPIDNWVAMPLEVPKRFKPHNLPDVEEKLKRIALWEKNCG